MKNVDFAFRKRIVAGVSAALVILSGGVFGTAAAPAALAAPAVDKYISGSDLYIAGFDSEQTSGEPEPSGPAAAAIDGNVNSYWHTNYSGGETPGPHFITVGAYKDENLQSCSFAGLEYTQRQGSSGEGAKNGIVGQYEIYVSDAAITQDSAFTENLKAAAGTFKDLNDPQLVKFDAEKSGKFVTLRAKSALVNSQKLTSVGEIRLVGSCKTAENETIVTPKKPAQSEDTAKIIIPTVEGVEYKIGNAAVTGEQTLKAGTTTVVAAPKNGFKFYGAQSVNYEYEYHGVPVPATIPSLKNDFVRTNGSWTLTQDAAVVRPESFAKSAQLLVDELNAYTEGAAIKGVSSGKGVEIVIDESQKNTFGEEGYRIEISDTGVKITAAENRGAFWGTRTLSQMLRQSLTLPGGSVTDAPAYAERGVTLCACQINFSTEWIERFLNEMADLKLNSVLMEMKLKSDAYPVANTFSYYSRDDVKKFVQKADSYGIDVIPEINSPGHMNVWLENLPDFQLKDQAGRGNADRLDITNPKAVKFYKTLIDEYDGVFSTKYWHMGADEYLMGANYAAYPQLAAYAKKMTGNDAATGADAFTYFINDINKYVKNKGKKLRIWNDGIVSTKAVTLDKDIIVEHWLGSGRSANQLANDDYKLVNANLKLYFARANPYPIQANGPAFLYDDPNFGVNIFAGNDGVVKKTENILGAKLSIWPDNGVKQTENEVEADIYEAMRYVAQITWKGGNPADNPTYADFKAKRVAKIKRSPMWENVNRKPLADGLYTISQPNGESLKLLDNAKLGGNDEWTLTSTPDHYYQLKNMTTNQCLSVVSGYKHLSTVTQVGARPEARPCADVSKIYIGNQAGNSNYSERNTQKWMLLPVGKDTFEVVNAVTLQHLAVAAGTEEHVDFRTFNGTDKNTKPSAGEVVQFPDDMTDDVWTIKSSTRSFSAAAEANPSKAYPSADAAGMAAITVTVTNRTDVPLTGIKVVPPKKSGWEFESAPKTIDSIPANDSAEVTFPAKPEWYLGDAEFVFKVSAGGETSEARVKVMAVCGLAAAPAAIVAADSEEKSGEPKPNGSKEKAGDGDPNTYWHTRWQGSTPDFPHYIDLQVGGESVNLCGFVYTPRQNNVNGRVKDFKIYAAAELPEDAAGWGEPIAAGSFVSGAEAQTVALNVKAKYLRLEGLNAQPGVGDSKVMSAGELQIIKGTAPKKKLVNPIGPAYEGLKYTIPAIDGVNYQVAGKNIEPGVYEAKPGEKLGFTAVPADGFYFADSFFDAEGNFIPWIHTFRKVIAPEEPIWDDAKMTFTIPDSEYFDYLIGSTLLKPGVQPTVAPNYTAQVTAQLKEGAAGVQVAPNAVTGWTHDFPNKAVNPGGSDPGTNPGTGNQDNPSGKPGEKPGGKPVQPEVPILDTDTAAGEKVGAGLAKTGAGVFGLLLIAAFLSVSGISVRFRRRNG
ncbi:family 20 glycosylhydrolase [Arcanobacterium hippocoleae]